MRGAVGRMVCRPGTPTGRFIRINRGRERNRRSQVARLADSPGHDLSRPYKILADRARFTLLYVVGR